MSMFGRDGLTADQEVRLRRVEQKLDAILNHLGIEVAERSGLSDRVRQYADKGQTIGAIKQYRDETGASLADAKRVVEEYRGVR